MDTEQAQSYKGQNAASPEESLQVVLFLSKPRQGAMC